MKKIHKPLMLLGTAGIIALSGCSITDADVDQLITTSTSFDDVLDSVSELTTVDENLEYYNYASILEEYTKNRKAEDLTATSDSLRDLGYLILKSSICDSLGLNPGSVKSLSLDVEETFLVRPPIYVTTSTCTVDYYVKTEKTVNGNIDISKTELCSETFNITAEGESLCSNIKDAEEHNLQTLEDADEVFQSYERFLTTSGEIVNQIFERDINYTYDEEKIKTLKNK